MNTIRQISNELRLMYDLRLLRNSDLSFVKTALQKITAIPNIKIAYAVAVTLKKIEIELSVLESIRQESEEFSSIREKLKEIQLQYAEKLPTGEPKIVQNVTEKGGIINQYVITDVGAFQGAILALEQAYGPIIQEQEIKEKNYAETMQERAQISLMQIDRNDIIGLELTNEQLYSVFFLLKDGISKEDIPEDITADELLLLMDYFNLS